MFKISKISVPKPRAYWPNILLKFFTKKNGKGKKEKREKLNAFVEADGVFFGEDQFEDVEFSRFVHDDGQAWEFVNAKKVIPGNGR